MRGLHHVRSMDVVVVGHICMVVILQSHHEGDESVGGNLEGLEQLTLLKVPEVGQSRGQLSFGFVESYSNRRLRDRTLGGVTWKMVYMVTVSGRFPEYSDILNMSIPHLFTSSISCGCATRADVITMCFRSRHWDNGHTQKKQTASYFGEEPFLAGVDPKARDGGGGEAGAVGGLLHAADLGHGPLLLVLLLGGRRHDVHVMLLLCRIRRGRTSSLRSACCNLLQKCCDV